MAMLTVTVTDNPKSSQARRRSINTDYIISAKPLDWSTTNLRWQRISLDIAYPGGAEYLHISATPELFAALHLGKITDQ